MTPDDVEQIKDDLLHFRAELEVPGVREELIRTGLPRLLATLDMMPETAREGSVLELGSSPYFLTLCLRRLCRGPLKLGNYFGTSEKRNIDRLVDTRTGEEVIFESDLFNIETEDFPYADASFDVVVFSELIEHLGLNPVRTLSEIHRVLKPGGHVVVTTPNSLSVERLESYLAGGSRMVDRYSPLFGYGARHNREYHPRELQELLEGCGFAVERMVVRDLAPLPLRARLTRRAWKWFLSRMSAEPREEHIFLRARRTDPFRWTFPARLFDNIEFYVLVRCAWVEMGVNDTIQCADGWHPVEPIEAEPGRHLRWTRGIGQGFLKAPAGRLAFGIEAHAPLGKQRQDIHLIVWDRWLGRVNPQSVYVDQLVSVEPGAWRTIELPLSRHPKAGEEVEVRIAVAPEKASAPGPTALYGRGEGVAVRRFWLREGNDLRTARER